MPDVSASVLRGTMLSVSTQDSVRRERSRSKIGCSTQQVLTYDGLAKRAVSGPVLWNQQLAAKPEAETNALDAAILQRRAGKTGALCGEPPGMFR